MKRDEEEQFMREVIRVTAEAEERLLELILNSGAFKVHALREAKTGKYIQ